MQTILGSGGAIGTPLAKELAKSNTNIRLVSRNPKKVNSTDTLHPADLTKPEDVKRAIAGSEICYVTVGFPYSVKEWRKTWPPFMKAVIEGCEAGGTKLVFFDNMYALSANALNPITETGKIDPPSRKGAVRAEVDKMVLDAAARGKIQAIIARAPDFFGPVGNTSMLMIMIYDNLKKGKGAQWMCNANLPHSFGYAPELAKGTAMLGNDPACYNQIWNLPVTKETLTGKEWAALFSAELGTKDKISTLPAWLVKTLGLFIPIMGELHEMLYQYDRPYVFDSSKFNKHFGYTPISNKAALKGTLAELKS
jgi:nucleoside-diphosphate-sugar epimerase